MRLTTKSAQARGRVDGAAAVPEQAEADGTAPAGFPLALDPRLYRDPAVLQARGQCDLLSAPGSTPATSATCPRRASTSPLARGPAGPGPARRRRRAAGVPQRLPPPRLRASDRQRSLQEGDPLPLSRLDLRRHRRPAARRARAPRVRRAPGQVGTRVDPGPGRGARRVAVRQPRPRRRAAGPGDGRARRASGAATGFPSSPSSRARRVAGASRPSRRTGRSWSRTTSRATTCRSHIPV